MTKIRNTLIGALALGTAMVTLPGVALADADRTARTITRVEAQIVGLESINDPYTRQREAARLNSELHQLEVLSASQGGKQARRNDARIDQLQANLRTVDLGGRRGGRDITVFDVLRGVIGQQGYQGQQGGTWNDGNRQPATRVSARLDQIEREVAEVRTIRNPNRRAARIAELDATLARLEVRSERQRGQLSEVNDRRIDGMRAQLARLDRRAARWDNRRDHWRDQRPGQSWQAIEQHHNDNSR